MKFLFKTLIVLLFILFLLKFIIHFFNDGHKINYSIKNFNIKETLTVNSFNKIDNYYFEIQHEDFKLNFQIFEEFNKKEKIIDKIKYIDSGEYKCLLPIFKGNKIVTDIMCLKGNIITYYRNIKDKKIDEFAENLKSYGYNSTAYIDKAKGRKLSNTEIIYENNLIENHYIALETYKGIELIGEKIKTVMLFDNDVYKKTVSMFTDKYYIVADYNEQYAFKKFYVVNIINGNIKEIRSYNEMSFDSVMQGAFKDDIYIFDKDAEIQYKISLKYETVEQIATKDNIKYYNGKWGTMSLSEALEGKKFDKYYNDKIDDYVKVDKPFKNQGYYYLYKKQDNKYLVYRADIQNPKYKTYLFVTDDLNSIIYLNEYVYFKNDLSYFYYNNGIKKVVENKELEFNKDIKFGAYIK